MSEDRHEGWARKSAALSRAYEMERKDKAGSKSQHERKHKTMECSVCKKEKPCLPFRSTINARSEGSASFAYETKWMCDDCAPKEKQEQFNPKKVKSLLRSARKGRI